MPGIPFGKTLEHLLCQKPLAPQGNEPLYIEIPRMQ
jgi:hypothetical protein